MKALASPWKRKHLAHSQLLKGFSKYSPPPQKKSRVELIQCSSNYKNVPDASNRKKAVLSGGKNFDISRRNEISGCQTGQERSHDSNDFDSYDELEQKMIEIAEKQEKIRKIDKNSFNNLQNCTLNFNYN